MLKTCSSASTSTSHQSFKASKPKKIKQSTADIHSKLQRSTSITSLPPFKSNYNDYKGEASDEDSDFDIKETALNSEEQSISVTSLSGEVQPVASKVADEHCSPKTLHTKLNQHHDSFSDDPKFEEKISRIENNFGKRISNLEEILPELQKIKEEIRVLKENQSTMENALRKQKAVEQQETSVAELQEKAKEIKDLRATQHELQSTIQKLKSALMEVKDEHDNKLAECTEEIQKYKNLNEALKQKAEAELQEKTKEIEALKESKLELQSTIETTLREVNIEHDSKVAEYTKEIQKYKNLIETKNQKTVERQETSVAELQEKTKEIKDLRATQHELQSTIQKLKSALMEVKDEHDSKLAECTEEIQKYKNLNEAEKQKAEAELQEKTKEIEALKENKLELQSTIEKLETTLREVKNKHDSTITEEIQRYKNLSEAEKQNTVKIQETSAAKLQEKAKEIEALKKPQPELQSTIQKLENTSKGIKDEHDSEQMDYIKEDRVKESINVKENGQTSLDKNQAQNALDQPKPQPISNSKRFLGKSKPASMGTARPPLPSPLSPTSCTMGRAARPPPPSPLPPRRSSSIKPKSGDPSKLTPTSPKLHPDHKLSEEPSPKVLALKPQMFEVSGHVIPKIMNHWKDVALHSLCYDSSMIEEIEKKNPSDPKQCCFDLFKDWLKTEHGVTPKTWETLLTQLRKVEQLADKVDDITKQLSQLI